MLLTLFRYVH